MNVLKLIGVGLLLAACGTDYPTEIVAKTDDGKPIYTDTVEIWGSEEEIQILENDDDQVIWVLEGLIQKHCEVGRAKYNDDEGWEYDQENEIALVKVFYTCE